MADGIAGIDIGTSSIKGVVVARNGQLLASVSLPYVEPMSPGMHAPAEVMQTLVQVIGQLRSASAETFACVSFSTYMHSWMAMDADSGEPLTGLWLWSHPLGGSAAEELMQEEPLAKTIYQQTGTPIHGMSPLNKAHALQKDMSGKTVRWSGLKDWLWQQLTGEWAMDVSTAGATGLYNPTEQQWCEEALDWAGVAAAQLGRVVPVTHTTRLRQPWAGLARDTLLCIGSNDGCSAMWQTHWMAPGLASLTIGSSVAARRLVTEFQGEWPEMPFCYPLKDKAFVLGAPGNNGGLAIQWILEKLLHLSLESDSYTRLAAIATDESIGTGDLIFLPFIHGERAPLWQESLRPSWQGHPEHYSKPAQAKAAVEGTFLQMSLLVELLRLPPGQPLVLSGGLSRSRSLMQLLATVLDRPCELVKSEADASAMGAALLGFEAIGWLLPPPDADFTLLSPQAHLKAMFDRKRSEYRAAVERVRKG